MKRHEIARSLSTVADWRQREYFERSVAEVSRAQSASLFRVDGRRRVALSEACGSSRSSSVSSAQTAMCCIRASLSRRIHRFPAQRQLGPGPITITRAAVCGSLTAGGTCLIFCSWKSFLNAGQWANLAVDRGLSLRVGSRAEHCRTSGRQRNATVGSSLPCPTTYVT